MRFWLTFVILAAALFLGARFAYRHLRPPDPDYRRGEESAMDALASLPQSCQRASPPKPTSKRGEAAQTFDLRSIKLYSPAREAVAQVAKLPQFAATPDVLMRSCVSDELAYNERVRASEKPGQVTVDQNCVGQITYRSAGGELKLDLIEDLPDQPGCMVVAQVSDARPAEMSDVKAEGQVKEEFEKRYGRLDNQATLWGENSGAHLMLTRGRTDILLELADTEFAQQRDAARANMIKAANEKAKADAAAKRRRTRDR